MKFICATFVWVACDVSLMCYTIPNSCSWKKKYKIKIFNNKLTLFWINVSFWMSDCDNMPQVFSSTHYWYLSENSDFFSMGKGGGGWSR